MENGVSAHKGNRVEAYVSRQRGRSSVTEKRNCTVLLRLVKQVSTLAVRVRDRRIGRGLSDMSAFN